MFLEIPRFTRQEPLAFQTCYVRSAPVPKPSTYRGSHVSHGFRRGPWPKITSAKALKEPWEVWTGRRGWTELDDSHRRGSDFVRTELDHPAKHVLVPSCTQSEVRTETPGIPRVVDQFRWVLGNWMRLRFSQGVYLPPPLWCPME